jgi:macrolide transport system ATP-binding/permease protein
MPWIARVHALLRREKLTKELDEELAFHLAMREQRNIEQGMPVAEAQRAARLRFGNPLLWRERLSEIDVVLLPQTVLQDVRYGIRMLLRNPGFSIVAVVALALGIGVNTTIFTAYKAFFALPLDAHDPGTMVNLGLILHSGEIVPNFSNPDYQAYRNVLHSLSGVIAQGGGEQLSMSGADGIARQRNSGVGSLVEKLRFLPVSASTAQFASVLFVSENYFQVLGVTASRGRLFKAEDTQTLSTFPSVVISENYWQREFAGDLALLGKTIRLNGIAFTIIGVTPHNFAGTMGFAAPDFWLPLTLEPLIHANDNLLHDRESECCRLFARLGPGVSISQAQSEMNALAGYLRTLHDAQSERSMPVTALIWPGSPWPRPLKQFGGLRFAILLIMAAGGMVLVIACANVASLQLARTASRQNELSMRLSLGASRFRLIRQLLTESALMGLLAGAFALLFSWAFLKALAALLEATVPAEYGTLIYNMNPDPAVFAYVFAISLVAGILFGLAPALESSRSALANALRAHMGASQLRSRRLRDSLIAAQVSAALTLMIAGSLLIRSSLHVLREDPGYNLDHVVCLQLQFPDGTRYTPERKLSLLYALRERLAALPGVAATTIAHPPPFPSATETVSLRVGGSSPETAQTVVGVDYVQSNYFRTVSIPLLAGHTFEPRSGDHEASVILSKKAAERLWSGRNPIGLSLRLGAEAQSRDKSQLSPNDRTFEVIGIVRDVRGDATNQNDAPLVYFPLADKQLPDYPILIRTHADPEQLISALAPVISSTDPDLVAHASTVSELFRMTPPFTIPSTAAAIATVVGVIGLLLASMGIYGTVSYVVVLRTREIGVRMALGARKKDILRLMLGESIRPVFAGLLLGTGLAVGVSYLLRRILYGLNTVDGISFAGVSALFLFIALFAAYVPSRRAMRVDPVVALRAE